MREGLIGYFSRYTRDQQLLRGGLSHVLLAGRDTTGALLTNLWSIIGGRPEIWSKLQEEVAALEGRVPTADNLRSMRYLRSCINEGEY